MVRESQVAKLAVFVLGSVLLSHATRYYMWAHQSSTTARMIHILDALAISVVCLLAWRLVSQPGARRIVAVFGIALLAQGLVWFALQLRWSTPGADVPLTAWLLGAFLDGTLMAIAVTVSALVSERLFAASR